MTYQKPNISYTEMAKYIDEHTLDKDNEELIFQYLYHIIYMLSHQAKYFYKYQDYDDFAIFAASSVYMRLIDEKQEPIKSCLNYIKSIIYALKVQYQNQFWSDSSENIDNINYADLSYIIDEYTAEVAKSEFKLCIESIDNIIKSYVYRLPQKRNSSRQKNIYISILLTLLSYITLTSDEKKSLVDRPIDSNVINRLYAAKRLNNVILYHLDESYTDMIKVATNRCMKLIAKNLSISTHTYNTSTITAANLLVSSIGENSWE